MIERAAKQVNDVAVDTSACGERFAVPVHRSARISLARGLTTQTHTHTHTHTERERERERERDHLFDQPTKS